MAVRAECAAEAAGVGLDPSRLNRVPRRNISDVRLILLVKVFVFDLRLLAAF